MAANEAAPEPNVKRKAMALFSADIDAPGDWWHELTLEQQEVYYRRAQEDTGGS